MTESFEGRCPTCGQGYHRESEASAVHIERLEYQIKVQKDTIQALEETVAALRDLSRLNRQRIVELERELAVMTSRAKERESAHEDAVLAKVSMSAAKQREESCKDRLAAVARALDTAVAIESTTDDVRHRFVHDEPIRAALGLQTRRDPNAEAKARQLAAQGRCYGCEMGHTLDGNVHYSPNGDGGLCFNVEPFDRDLEGNPLDVRGFPWRSSPK